MFDISVTDCKCMLSEDWERISNKKQTHTNTREKPNPNLT